MNVTYQIEIDQNGDLYIECLHCGLRSYHPSDISERYCGQCHQFHVLMELRLNRLNQRVYTA